MSKGNTAGNSAGPAARGFTLVELLVALVVLMIGIYAMLRIFPRGFSAIEYSQQRTTAAQIAESEIARWRLHPESLPDAIVATDYQGNLVDATLINNPLNLQTLLVYGELAAQIPGTTNYSTVVLPRGDVDLGTLDFFARPLIYSPLDVTPSQFDAALGLQGEGRATLHPNWQPNSLYLPRTVIGERIDIRQLGRTALGFPFYLLSHAPLDVLRYEGEDSPATPLDERARVYVDIYDAEAWRYIPGGAAIALADRQFTVDNGSLYFGPTAAPPAQQRFFKVDYTDPITLQRVLGGTVVVAPGATIGLPALPLSVDPATIQVHERLRPLSPEEYADYQLRFLDWPRNAYYVDTETTISGRIEFSPALQMAPRAGDMKLVKVDYRVYDWGVLVFDIEVPPDTNAPGDSTVRLPVQRLKGPASTNPPRQPRPQEVARGIRRQYDWQGNITGWEATNPLSWAYVVAVDRQTGQILADHEGLEWPANPWERRTRFRVDYRAGLLYFNYDPDRVYQFSDAIDTPNRTGRTYRIFCRAENDWAVQLMVAPRRYARSADRFPGGRAAGAEASAAGVTYAWNTDRPQQIYFPLSEAGQTVMVDYYAQDGSFLNGEVHTISVPNVTDLGQWACRLTEPLAKAPNQWGPVVVRGIGVRARAIWVTPGHSYTVQELSRAVDDVDEASGRPDRPRPVVREAWRQVIITTYLTRAPI